MENVRPARSIIAAKKHGELMARVMLVIRKIVDRRAYNRANIVDLIPALSRTERANRQTFRALRPPPAAPVSPSSMRRDEDLREISLGSFIFHGDAFA